MNHAEIIAELLQNGGMTQSALRAAIGDGKSIYWVLQKLEELGAVVKSDDRPAVFSLTEDAASIIADIKPKAKNTTVRNVSDVVINNVNLDEAERQIAADPNYGPEIDLVRRCLQRFPENTDADIVAMKIGLIDITNSTHLSQQKSKINMAELCRIIANIPEIDQRIADGDREVVDEIARSNGNINLISFASKYCCYHNRYVYDKDDYSIIDTILRKCLPLYFKEDTVTYNQIQKFTYSEYSEYIDRNLDLLGITTDNRRKKLDNLVWYINR